MRNHILTVASNTFCTPNYTLSDPSISYTTTDFYFPTVHQAQLYDTLNVEGVKVLYSCASMM